MLQEFPFDADRKRMSVLVRKRNDSRLFLLSKGAESVMFPRISGLSPKEMSQVDDQVYNFATKGFRVMVIAKKEVDEGSYNRWKLRFDEVRLSFHDNKQQRLYELYDEFEQELSFLGSTAVEDKLQEEVPETIQHLMDAKIKVWVLTGDRQETAIEIAKSCNLINLDSMDMIILTAKTRTEFVIRLRESFNDFVSCILTLICVTAPIGKEDDPSDRRVDAGARAFGRSVSHPFCEVGLESQLCAHLPCEPEAEG